MDISKNNMEFPPKCIPDVRQGYSQADPMPQMADQIA